MDLRSEA